MKISKHSLIQSYMEMIDAGVEYKDLNLRKLARRVGCAHTNMYNYFSSWDELRWHAISSALAGLLDDLPRSSGEIDYRRIPGPSERGNLFDTYLQYAGRYPHRYRLVWLDPLMGDAPESTALELQRASVVFSNWIRRWMPGPMKNESDINRLAHILHCYMHGELVFISAGRSTGRLDQENIDRISRCCSSIFASFTRQAQNGG